MKAVLFARVSSREQQETGYSLPAQEKFLKDYADKHHFDIEKVFSISESASGRKEREIFNSMMAFVRKQGLKIIVCEKVDRLTRNFKDAVTIDEWLEKDGECQIHLVKDSIVLHKNSRSQEKLNWGIRILLAKNYIDNLSEEVKKGQKEKISQGWLPTKPPLGYKSVGEDGRRIHVIDEEKAPLVREMFELYATGHYSTKSLVKKMHKEGLRTQFGNTLVKSRVHDHLSNPFYYGKLLWNDELYEGKHEPLITKELFDKVQYILYRKTTPKVRKHDFLFKGLMKCHECKGLMTWEVQKGITYGHCNHYRNCTQKKWSRQQDVENQLMKEFESLQIRNLRLMEWIRKALKESHEDQAQYHNAAINELKARYDQIQKRLDRLYDDKVDDKISRDFYERRCKEYTQEKEDVVSAIGKHSNASDKYFDLGINFYDLSQRARDIFIKARPEEKRQLITMVFSELTLDAGKLHPTFTAPFQLLFKAAWSTNSSKQQDFEKIPKKIFEPIKMPGISIQNDIPGTYRPNWLPS